MAFTAEDLASLLRLLDEEPQLRRALGERLLSESQRRVEEAISELAAAQGHTTQHLDLLTTRVDALTEGLTTLTARVDTLTDRVDTLSQGLTTLTATVEGLARRFDSLADMVEAMTRHMGKLTDWVGELRGEAFERRFREQASTRFAPLARRLRLLTGPALDDLLDDAVDAGTLTEDEAHQVRLADAVVRGRRRDDGSEVLLVAGISAGVGVSDVQRAWKRADLLARLGRPTLPVVAGEWVSPEGIQAARDLGVWQLSATGLEPPPDPPPSAVAS